MNYNFFYKIANYNIYNKLYKEEEFINQKILNDFIFIMKSIGVKISKEDTKLNIVKEEPIYKFIGTSFKLNFIDKYSEVEVMILSVLVDNTIFIDKDFLLLRDNKKTNFLNKLCDINFIRKGRVKKILEKCYYN